MRIPVIQGIIDRRILVNYRVQPEAMADVLPPPFEPLLIHGHAIGGICLIRLKQVRPRFVPLPMGIASENAAHRIAVQWQEEGERREGVYIPRRDTDSCFNAWGGGRIFPGDHHHARFTVEESDARYTVTMDADDGAARLTVSARRSDRLPSNSIFTSLAEASAFFERGRLGYSATARPRRFDGLELRCKTWQVTPLEIETVRSSFFDDTSTFPPGSVTFDCALLMKNIAHEWRGRTALCCEAAPLM